MNAIIPQRITIPGVYDMPAERYHADPCETPSLSAGMINDILIAPALCRHNSQRLNPDWEAEPSDKFTIGTVAHVMFLEPDLFEEKIAVCDFDDWRSAKAKMQRDQAREAGKTPILTKHMDKVNAARAAFLSNNFTRRAFTGGKYEQSLFWKHPDYGFWCRARPDFIADGAAHLNDYKATSNASPEQFGKHAYGMGYHRRAAWYLEGAEIVFGKRPEHYWFCNQEIKAPHLTSVVELKWGDLEAGKIENDRAAERFARCLKTNDWYGYRHAAHPDQDLAFQVSLPTWAHIQIEQRVI